MGIKAAADLGFWGPGSGGSNTDCQGHSSQVTDEQTGPKVECPRHFLVHPSGPGSRYQGVHV